MNKSKSLVFIMMFILAFNLVQVFSIDNVYASDMDREEREQIRKEWEERQKRGGEKKWGRRRENTKSSKKSSERSDDREKTSDKDYTEKIDKFKEEYNRAKNRGDKKGMEKAHNKAEAFRKENNPDYKGSADGSADDRYNREKLKDLREKDKERYDDLADAVSKGGKVKIDVKEDGTTNIKVENTTKKTVEKMSRSEKIETLNKMIDRGEIKSSIGNGLELNTDLFIEKGIISYGDIDEVNSKNKNTSNPNAVNNQYRYWGYDANGNLYTNSDFQDDVNLGISSEDKNWISNEIVLSNKHMRDLIGLDNYDAFDNYNDKINTAQKFLEQNSNWKDKGWTAEEIVDNFSFQSTTDDSGITQGSFVGIHKKDGHTYYETFTVDPDPIEYEVGEEIEITIEPDIDPGPDLDPEEEEKKEEEKKEEDGEGEESKEEEKKDPDLEEPNPLDELGYSIRIKHVGEKVLYRETIKKDTKGTYTVSSKNFRGYVLDDEAQKSVTLTEDRRHVTIEFKYKPTDEEGGGGAVPPEKPSKPDIDTGGSKEEEARKTTGKVTIKYMNGSKTIYSNSLKVKITEGKSYKITVPARNFWPVYKLVDQPNKIVTLTYNSPDKTVVFNYTKYYANGRVNAVVRPIKMKSGYGFEVQANSSISTNFSVSELQGNPAIYVEFLGNRYRLENISGGKLSGYFELPYNPDSMINARRIYTPVELEDGSYKAKITFEGVEKPVGYISGGSAMFNGYRTIRAEFEQDVMIEGNMYQDDYTKPK